jgi:zinc transporter ZupT
MVAFLGGHTIPAPAACSVVMVGWATVIGVALARRHAARRELLFGAAAGALLVIATVHLLPDAVAAGATAGFPPLRIAAVSVFSFAIAGVFVRRGCACGDGGETVGGRGAAVALTGHRLLEGAALMVTGSVTVAIALVVHALAEGLAAGALLQSVSRRQAAWWLGTMCVSPVVGGAVAECWTLPAFAQPVLLAAAVGMLAQAVRVSLSAAFRHVRLTHALLSSPAVAVLIAGLVTTIAIHVAG